MYRGYETELLRKTRLRALAVIMAGFVIPVSIFSFDEYGSELSKLTYYSALMADPSAQTEADDTGTGSQEISTAPGSENILDKDIDMALSDLEPEIKVTEIPNPVQGEDISWVLPYPKDLTDHDGPILKYTYGHYTDDGYFDLPSGGQVRNCTTIPEEELKERAGKGLPFELDPGSVEPQVLIYHTHTTESFELEDKDWYDSDFNAKTTEPDKNITAVGDVICQQLENAGVCYIHDTLVHDYPSYDTAYQSSRAAVQEILEQYPSIKICLDIHRDGIERQDGTRVAPVAWVAGREAAQIMIISCAEDGSGNIPDFMDNFSFACTLQQSLESSWPGLTRPVLFDTRYYNQDLSTGALLIEVGSHGNSLDQAKYSGELLGKTLAKLFTR